MTELNRAPSQRETRYPHRVSTVLSDAVLSAVLDVRRTHHMTLSEALRELIALGLEARDTEE
jgi:hypothetical protein